MERSVAPKCSRAEQRKVKASGGRRFAPKEQCKRRPEHSTPAACRHEEQHDQPMGQIYSFQVPGHHFCFILKFNAWNGPCARCLCHEEFVTLPYCKIYVDMWHKRERKWTSKGFTETTPAREGPTINQHSFHTRRCRDTKEDSWEATVVQFQSKGDNVLVVNEMNVDPRGFVSKI